MCCMFPSLHPFSAPLLTPKLPLCPLRSVRSSGQVGLGASGTQCLCSVWCVAGCASLLSSTPIPSSALLHSHSFFLFVNQVFPLVIFYNVISSSHPQMSLHLYDCWRIIQLLRLHFGTYWLRWGVSHKNTSQKTHNATGFSGGLKVSTVKG